MEIITFLPFLWLVGLTFAGLKELLRATLAHLSMTVACNYQNPTMSCCTDEDGLPFLFWFLSGIFFIHSQGFFSLPQLLA